MLYATLFYIFLKKLGWVNFNTGLILIYMQVVFIGSGNTATVLGRQLKAAGHVITGVYSKTVAHAQQLAVELNAHYGDAEAVTANADIYIIAVNDDSIAATAGRLQVRGKIIVHTSGSVPCTVLSAATENYGVLYPLQSLRKQAVHQPAIPFLVNGSNAQVLQQVKLLAQSISAMVEEATDEQRLKLHLAAVVVSNFTNHLYALAQQFCQQQQVPFNTLVPLIQEVANRTAQYSPAVMQTGPAARGDMATITKHIALLNTYPLLQKMYIQATDSILSFYGKGEDGQ